MKKSILFLLLISGFTSIGQNYYNDAQVWFNLYLEKKITKRFLVHLNQQDRWTKNVSQYTLGYADIGITLKLTKNIKLLVDYVYAEKRKKTDYFSTRHQYYAALVLKKDIRRWRISYRNMFQFQYNDPFTSKDGMIAYYYDRSKITIKYYATRRLNFYVAEELYSPLNNQQLKGLDRSRSFAGLFINLTKQQQLEFYFMLQCQLQKGDWYKQHNKFPNDMLNHDYVYGIGYSIQF